MSTAAKKFWRLAFTLVSGYVDDAFAMAGKNVGGMGKQRTPASSRSPLYPCLW
jgi:hypothetical protein